MTYENPTTAYNDIKVKDMQKVVDIQRGSESSAMSLQYGTYDVKHDNVPSVVNSPNKLDSQRFD